mgnify:CR=1 FL=1
MSEAEAIIKVNPARAGMILTSRAFASQSNGKPRASGDDPVRLDLLETLHE